VDFIEDAIGALPVSQDGTLSFDLKPYQIRTVRLVLKP
jgi:hypothetical protein